MNPSSASLFNTAPGICNRIHNLVVPRAEFATIKSHKVFDSDDSRSRETCSLPAISRACRLVCQETLPLFHCRNILPVNSSILIREEPLKFSNMMIQDADKLVSRKNGIAPVCGPAAIACTEEYLHCSLKDAPARRAGEAVLLSYTAWWCLTQSMVQSYRLPWNEFRSFCHACSTSAGMSTCDMKPRPRGP